MSNETQAAGGGMVFHEIKTLEGDRAYRYASLRTLTYLSVALVAAFGLAAVLQSVALFGQWRLLSSLTRLGVDHNYMALARRSDAFVNMSAVVASFAAISAFIVNGIWTYKAACNVRALGAKGLDVSPAGAVAWYLVPIAAIFRPFQAMVEISKASASPQRWRAEKTPPLLGAWWAAWLSLSVVGAVQQFQSIGIKEARSVPLLIDLTGTEIAGCVARVIAAGLFIAVVWRVYRAQAHSYAAGAHLAAVFA
jgi:hypothetical protein